MMDRVFLLQLVLSFFVGSIWVLLTTYLADRFGSKIGGFLGGLPSTASVSFFFIGLTQSPLFAAEATTVFPLSYAFTGLFLLLYASFWRRGFAVAFSLSLLAWFLCSACVVVFNLENFILSVCLYIFFFIGAVYILEYRMKLLSIGKGAVTYTAFHYLMRALFGGIIVAFAVLMSQVGGPIFGGIFSAFPAVFISVLIINYRSRGMEFSRAMAKPLLVTGMVSNFLYGLGIRYFYPAIGLSWGTVASYVLSILGAVLSYFLIQKRLC